MSLAAVKFLVIAVAAVVGLIIKVFLDNNDSDYEITWTEFALGLIAISFILVPIASNIGYKMAWNSQVSFNEYWNGWETNAVWNVTPCTRDGPCINEYKCDPYLVPYRCNCDDEGNCDTCYRTEHHACPYCDEEWTFIVETSIGDVTIANHVFPTNPRNNRFRSYDSLSQGVIDRVGFGVPVFWEEANARIKDGNPGPATLRKQYDNLILASEQTILQQYSDKIDSFLTAGVLPDVQFGVRDFYNADKVYFVGYSPSNPQLWQERHSYLNGSVGTELQGDLHLVIVKDPLVLNDPDGYLLALKAYWQDSSVWGDDSISKNSIIVVLGTDDGVTISWGRAITGMPLGNEMFTVAVRNSFADHLQVALDPSVVLGNMSGEFWLKPYDDGTQKLKVRASHNDQTGILEDIIWGISDPSTTFERVSMSGDDADDIGSGFGYLAGEIQPTSGQMWRIGIGAFFAAMLAWFITAFLGTRVKKYKRYSFY